MQVSRYYEDNKNNMAMVALNLFLENGYEDTSLQMIMKAVNSSKGGMYHYFSSKEEILDLSIRLAYDDFRPQFEALLKQAPTFEDQLLLFFQNHQIGCRFMTDFYKSVIQAPSSFLAYRIRECEATFAIEHLTEVLRAGNEQGFITTNSPEIVASYYYTMGEVLNFRCANIWQSSEHEKTRVGRLQQEIRQFISFGTQMFRAKPESEQYFASRLFDSMVDDYHSL